MKLTNHTMLNLRSRHNGYNSFVKYILLDTAGIDHNTLENPKKWPKEMLGKEIKEEVYKILVKYKNIHLDDIQKYKKLETDRQAMRKSKPDYWNNR